MFVSSLTESCATGERPNHKQGDETNPAFGGLYTPPESCEESFSATHARPNESSPQNRTSLFQACFNEPKIAPVLFDRCRYHFPLVEVKAA